MFLQVILTVVAHFVLLAPAGVPLQGSLSEPTDVQPAIGVNAYQRTTNVQNTLTVKQLQPATGVQRTTSVYQLQ